MTYDVEICTVRAKATSAPPEGSLPGTPLPEGFCFLISRSDGTLVQPAFDFFAHSYLTINTATPALSCAKNTAAAIAQDLCDFHHFLDAKRLKMSDVSKDVLEEYATALKDLESVVTLKRYQPATVHRRWSSLTKLVAYCVKNGYLKEPAPLLTKQTKHGQVEVLDIKADLPGLNDADEHITALHPETVAGILDSLGPNPLIEHGQGIQLGPDTTSQRLMGELCYQAGLRRTEACEVRTTTVLATRTKGRDPLTCVSIPVTGKGRKKRNVPVPVWLLDALKQYAATTRQRLIERRQQHQGKPDHGFLFVLDINNKKHVGNPITPQTFDRHFALAREKLLNTLAAKQDDQRHEHASRERITIHALRHTFALYTYMDRRAHGDMDAIKYVQSVLGHTMRDTTESIYLRSANAFESQTRESIRIHIENQPFMRQHADR